MLQALTGKTDHGGKKINPPKIALALACSDWALGDPNNQITIQLGHFALAQTIVERSRDSLHRLMPVLSQSSDARTQRNLLTVIKQATGGLLSVRDIVRATGRNTNEVRSALEVLIESGDIEMIEHKPAGLQGGRATQLYKLMSSV